MKTLKILLYTILIIYLLLGLLLYLKQRSILYMPSSTIETPFEEMHFKHDGIDIKSFVVNQNHDDAIIYFGGNAENVAYSVKAFQEIFPNHTLYFINYRGYGGSSGKPTEKGLDEDALFIYDTLQKKHKNINLIGRSLGSGVATYLTSKRQIKRLVLVTPFDSILSVGQELFPIYPLFIILQDQYNSLARVKAITAEKTLILYAIDDKIISYKHTQKLADAFEPLKLEQSFLIKGHNNIQESSRYYKRIKNFIEEGSKSFQCSYYVKPTKELPYGEIKSFNDCGTLRGDELILKEKHIKNLGFKKGEESKYALTTIYSSAGFFNVTQEGKTLKMFIFDNGTDYFREGLARYISNGKIGFANTKLEVVIPAKYDHAQPFKNGIAIVGNECHKERATPQEEHYSIECHFWGAVNKKGEVVFPVKYNLEELSDLLKYG